MIELYKLLGKAVGYLVFVTLAFALLVVFVVGLPWLLWEYATIADEFKTVLTILWAVTMAIAVSVAIAYAMEVV